MDFKLKKLLVFVIFIVSAESLTASFFPTNDIPKEIGPGISGFTDMSHISFDDDDVTDNDSTEEDSAEEDSARSKFEVIEGVYGNGAGNVALSSKTAQDALRNTLYGPLKKEEEVQEQPSHTGCLSFFFNKKN